MKKRFKSHARRMLHASCFILPLLFAGCAMKEVPTSQPGTRLAPLKLFWDGRDNYTTSTPLGESDALSKGYKFRRVEGFVFTRPQPGTTALKQYWSEARHDHWLLARDIPKNVEKNGAYQFVRVEGYVYTNAQPGTVALKHFSKMRGDNFTFTSQSAENEARAGGYGQRKLFHAFVIPNGENSAATIAPAPQKKFSGATPLEWSQRLADSEMARRSNSLSWRPDGKAKWDYTAGLFTLSLLKLHEVTPNAGEVEFTKQAIGSFIAADGNVQTYRPEEFQLDALNPAKTVLALWQLTGEERYKIAAQNLVKQLETQPRTFDGGFWHKQRYTNQMWLDGIYMADPFHAECGKLFGDASAFDDVAKQIRLIDGHTSDAKTGLNYHGWDAAKIQPWANPTTGCSSNFWGRAEGWYAMALVDVLDYFPANHPARGAIISTLQKLAKGVVKFQDAKTGLWYQVLDQGNRQGNYLEATASAMFVYALAKGVNHGYLSRDFVPAIERGYAGIIQNLITDDGNGQWSLTKCCSVAGLGGSPSNGHYRSGSFDYYIGEPVVSNDLKGVGPFILAGIEMEKLH